MIASVVATLNDDGVAYDIIAAIASLPNVEVGAINGNVRRIPITIDSPAANSLEEITRRIQECPGVAFVDVVFVHFETADAESSTL